MRGNNPPAQSLQGAPRPASSFAATESIELDQLEPVLLGRTEHSSTSVSTFIGDNAIAREDFDDRYRFFF
jgi:hypothetical protein